MVKILILQKLYLKKKFKTNKCRWFYSKIIDLNIEGNKEKVLPKQLQYNPVTDRLIHIDFLRVQEDTKVTVEVQVDFLNKDICPGLKKGGVLNTVRRLVELSCNANKIPEKLEFDLVSTEIGDAIKISNIELPEGVEPTITDRDFVVATLVPPTVEVEETKAEETEGDSETEKTDQTEEESKGKDATEDKKKNLLKKNLNKKTFFFLQFIKQICG